MATSLVMDAGGTKVTYALLKERIAPLIAHTQTGIVPYLLSEAEITAIFLQEVIPNITLAPTDIHSVFYYGSGCSISQNRIKMEGILRTIFTNAFIFVGHDMLGAARAICQKEKGIVAILGTGSSACIYDGEDIETLRAGIGYILGDEGSGAFMGKLLFQKICYGFLEPHLEQSFFDYIGLTRDEIINKVYLEAAPNRFLASFARFLKMHITYPSIREIIYISLRLFFTNHIIPLTQIKNYPLSFVGGVAFMFQEEMNQLAEEFNLELKKISRNPIEGIVTYHQIL